MPERGSENSSGERASELLAKELKDLREQSGKSLAELADDTTFDRTYLSRLENGQKKGSEDVIAALQQVYGARHLLVLWRAASDSVFRDAYREHMANEEKATIIQVYAAATIPGLLQTEQYAREVLSASPAWDASETEVQVQARLTRGRRLLADRPPHYRAVLDEAVFARPCRDHVAWAQQLDHLLTLSKLPHVVLQVLPFASGQHALVGGSVEVLWNRKGKPVGYVEGGVTGDLIEDPDDFERLRLAYDFARDVALPPDDSAAFIAKLLEDVSTCAPPDPT